MIEVSILGPVRAARDGRRLPVGGPRQRGVLAALVLAGPTGVDTQRLLDDVWGSDLPPSATRTAQAYLSRLRTTLGADVVVSRSGRHSLEQAEVDAWSFGRLREEARAEPARARMLLESAVALWHDRLPAADAAMDGAVVELAALARARLDTIEALLTYLDDDSAAEQAAVLLAEDPHREAAWERLAAALHRMGRRAEALATVRRARQVLVRDLGADPSPALAALEREMLALDPPRPRRGGVGVPHPVSELVGRDDELAGVCALLRSNRLVTLAGVGGVGKTRLAVEAARRLEAARELPVFFASLSGATSRRAVEDALLAAVAADGHADDVVDALASAVAARPAVVLVDECEHVVAPAADLVAAALARCPGLRVLATSRTRLGVTGEVLVDVGPLPVPSVGEADPATSPALRLFLDRASEVTGARDWDLEQLEQAADLCRQLDGIPLALEVTAGRLRYGPLRTVGRGSGPAVPGPGAAASPVATHDPLRAALDASYVRLPEGGRRAYRRLSLVHGPVPHEVAAGIAESDTAVRLLVDSSLLLVSDDGVRMYGPVRQHGADLLHGDERAAAERSLATHVLRFAERAAPELIGPDEVRWMATMERMRPDVATALDWARANDRSALSRLAAAVGYLWVLGWGVREGEVWLERAMVGDSEPRVGARLLVWSSYLHLRQGRRSAASEAASRAVALAQDAADPRLLGEALHALAMPDKYGRATERARTVLRQAVAVRRAAGDDAGTAMSVGALADIDLGEGRLGEAAAGYATGLPLMRRSGSARGLLAYLHSMAELALARGDLAQAAALVAEGRPLAASTRDLWHVAQLSVVEARCARGAGRPPGEQRRLAADAVRAGQEQTDPVVILDALEHAAGVLLDQGDARSSLRLLDGARILREAAGHPLVASRRPQLEADRRAAHRDGSSPRWPVTPDLDWLMAIAIDALG